MSMFGATGFVVPFGGFTPSLFELDPGRGVAVDRVAEDAVAGGRAGDLHAVLVRRDDVALAGVVPPMVLSRRRSGC